MPSNDLLNLSLELAYTIFILTLDESGDLQSSNKAKHISTPFFFSQEIEAHLLKQNQSIVRLIINPIPTNTPKMY